MLCDVSFVKCSITNMIAQARGNSTDVIRLREGVYQIGHFSFGHMISSFNEIDEWLDLDEFDFYGVCDSYAQIIEQNPVLETSERRFVISVTLVEKAKEPSSGGWRWRKWGPYIGEYKPTREYLYDEPKIEEVWVFHVYEILSS